MQFVVRLQPTMVQIPKIPMLALSWTGSPELFLLALSVTLPAISLHRARATSGLTLTSSAKNPKIQIPWIQDSKSHGFLEPGSIYFLIINSRVNRGTEPTKEVLSAISLSLVRIKIPACGK